MTREERIREINRLLNEAEDINLNGGNLSTPGLETELEELSDPVQDEPLPEGAETPSEEYHRIRATRDLKPTYSMLEDD